MQNNPLKSIVSKAKTAVVLLTSKHLRDQHKRNKKQAIKQLELKNAVDYSDNGIWPKSPELQPWFDQSDAKDIVANKSLPNSDKKILEEWIDNGYVIADVMDAKTCDKLRHEMLEDVWQGNKTFPNLSLLGMQRPGEEVARSMSQAELLSLTQDERQWMLLNNNWRIHGMDVHSSAFDEAIENHALLRIGALLFGEEARAGFTLSFGVGSEQALHQDYAQFHIYPRNYLIGCWIALEDIHPDSGPLEYYPKTHKLGYWKKHDLNYPQSNLRTSSNQDNADYFQWLREQSETTSTRKELIIKKGQALFWHASLAHGGSARKNKSLSRHSLVVHLVPKDFNVDKRLIIKPIDKEY